LRSTKETRYTKLDGITRLRYEQLMFIGNDRRNYQMSADSFDTLTVGDITYKQTGPQARSCRSESSVTDGHKACSRHFQLQWTHWPQAQP